MLSLVMVDARFDRVPGPNLRRQTNVHDQYCTPGTLVDPCVHIPPTDNYARSDGIDSESPRSVANSRSEVTILDVRPIPF